jgi:hypothetical protein
MIRAARDLIDGSLPLGRVRFAQLFVQLQDCELPSIPERTGAIRQIYLN